MVTRVDRLLHDQMLVYWFIRDGRRHIQHLREGQIRLKYTVELFRTYQKGIKKAILALKHHQFRPMNTVV